ncbi:MAG: alpha/beta fold hydrolase [Candidatus Lokiarchaeota archaeon]|nr:alpha/beta fold hydrolase [Candidatus Lokiarchaeota archaeon]MBD3338801.1 alpha/beta fold hydrolase [Candidatus Lokiarchaeota archaeon]
MPKVKVNDVELFYETIGDPSKEPLLLVMGQGGQMIRWNDELCEMFANKGFYVIRYDNRDVGLSTKFDDFGVPNLWEVAMAVNAGKKIEAPYTLEDMADDAVGLLDVLNISKAHICGVSMGGMIVQTIAYRHPERVASFTSIMSGTGKKGLPPPTPEVIKLFHKEAPQDKEGYVEHMVNLMGAIYGSEFKYDEEKSKNLFQRCVERSYHPAGYTRHYLAILVAEDRTEKLKSLNIPALVIHGNNDPLVRVEHGIQTAEAIPNAGLLIIKGMGHSLPPETYERISDALVKLSSRVKK